MSRGNGSFFENNYIVPIVPSLVDAATVESGWISAMESWRSAFIIILGATDITVNAKIQQATAAAGTGAKDITGAALTQIAATGDNKVYCIDLEHAKMDIAGGFCYLNFSVTAGDGTAGAYVAGLVVQHALRHYPVTQPASVAEIVVVAG